MSTISVIIPTYNRLKWLPRAIDSVLDQSHKDLELIIVDDGSTDGTDKLISRLNDSRAKYIKLDKNSGVSAARNAGIKTAQSHWIAFLDSDDEWLKYKLEIQLRFANENPNIKIIHSNEQWIRNGAKKTQPQKYKRYGGWIFDKCLPLCSIGPSTSLVHKSVFDDVGLFNEDFPVCEDYDFWLRSSIKYEVGLIEHILINKYAGHDDQLSESNSSEMDYWRAKALAPFVFNEKVFLALSDEVKTQLKNIMLQKCSGLLKYYSKIDSDGSQLQLKAHRDEVKKYLNSL